MSQILINKPNDLVESGNGKDNNDDKKTRDILVFLQKNGKKNEGTLLEQQQQQHLLRNINPVDNGERDGDCIKLSLNETDFYYLRNSNNYLSSIDVDPTTCTNKELSEWSKRLTAHHEHTNDILDRALGKAGIPSNYHVLAIMKSSLYGE